MSHTSEFESQANPDGLQEIRSWASRSPEAARPGFRAKPRTGLSNLSPRLVGAVLIGLLVALFSLAGYRYFFQNRQSADTLALAAVPAIEASSEIEEVSTAEAGEDPPLPPPAEKAEEEAANPDGLQIRTEPLRVQATPPPMERSAPQEPRKPALRLKPTLEKPKSRVVVRPEDLESEPAVLLTAPSAAYPDAARGTETSAEVIVGFTIDETGAVRDPSIESARVRGDAPEALFEQAALAAARQARFEPAREQGIPTSSRGTLTFSFETGTRPAGS